MSRADSPSPARAFARRTQRPSRLAFVAFLALMMGPGIPSAKAEEAPAAKIDPVVKTDPVVKIDPVIAEIDAFIRAHPVDKSVRRWRTKLQKPPLLKFDPAKTYTWKLDTNVGEIRFRMFDDIAPMHVSSTLYLTRLGYFDTLKFHRVISGFMAQGGDPLGNGRGGPGYRFAGEFDPKVVHDSAGLLSMANSGPRTDGSQFFITFRETPQLDGRHTIYGKAESKESLETLDAIEALGRPRDPAPPLKPLYIKTATILIE